MGSCQINRNHLLVDDQPFHIRGGEIQYFRLPINVWEDRLKLARDGGNNTVSSYMPWYFHEPVEGRVDLEGTNLPEHNLRRFLELSAKLGLKVIARPGPFINSELQCGGIPDWLFRNHPETMSRRSDGEYGTGRPLPAEGEPLYRQYVRRWYHAIVPLIAEYDIHRGGPVILFQPDNELSAAWSFGLLNSLYDPTILGKTWPAWLKQHHQTVEALADRYSHAVHSFMEVSPPRAFPTTIYEKRLCIDWMNFKRWFFADWGATLAQWAMENGVQVPFIFNEPVAGFYDHGDHAGFGAILSERGISGTTSCHTYSPKLMDLEGATGIAMAVALTKSSSWGGPPLSVEVNTNWYLPRLSRSEINWEPLMRMGLACGLDGSVIYPYSAGTVSRQDVIDGPEYFDPSCIDIKGKSTGGFKHLQRFNRFVHAWEKEILSSSPIIDLSLAYSPGQRYLDFLGAPALMDTFANRIHGPGGEAFNAEPTLNRSTGSPGHDWLDGYEAVSKQTIPAESGLWKKTKEAALLLTRMNMLFDLVELTNPNKKPGNGWIVVPCTGSLDKAAIDYLLQHLDCGGQILFFPTIPIYDLDGNYDCRLVERLNIKLIEQIRPAGGVFLDYGTRTIDFDSNDQTGVDGWIFVHDLPVGSHTLARYQDKPVIFTSGQIVVAGLDASFVGFSNLRLWQKVICEAMAVQPPVTVTGNYHFASLRKGKDVDILTVSNLSGQNGPGMVHLQSKSISFEVNLQPHEARCLVMGANLDGKRMIYTTSEIIPLNEDRNRLELHGHCGTQGQIVFAEPVKGYLNGQEVIAQKIQDYFRIDYRHNEDPLVLEL